eukprot:751089-Hanusia_phi.AAC.2
MRRLEHGNAAHEGEYGEGDPCCVRTSRSRQDVVQKNGKEATTWQREGGRGEEMLPAHLEVSHERGR